MDSDKDQVARQEIADLRNQVHELLEVVMLQGQRLDAYERQLDELKLDVNAGARMSDVVLVEQQVRAARTIAEAALRSGD